MPDLDRLSQSSFSCYLIAAFFAFTGSLHFIKPSIFINIIPDYIPFHSALVYITGGAELAGAIGILLPATRVITAYCLLAFLVAVFPANIDMAVKIIRSHGYASLYSLVMLVQLPLQFALMYWIYWAALKS